MKHTITSCRRLLVGFVGLGTAVLLTGCGGGSSGDGGGSAASVAATGSGTATVATHDRPGLGSVLVAADGKTLYHATEEADGSVRCTGACLQFWLPLTVDSGSRPTAATSLPGKLASVTRPDNHKAQVTYDGAPLYRFSLDTTSDTAKGDNVGDEFGGTAFTWHAVVVAADTTSDDSSDDSGGGYSY